MLPASRRSRATAARAVRFLFLLGALALAPASARAQQPAPPAPAVQGGRIFGTVVDKETGRPIPGVTVSVTGRAGSVTTDLDGRYRTAEVPAGAYSVQARLIGYQAMRQDSVRVKAGEATSLNFAMTQATVEIQELVVQSAVQDKVSTEAGLLAMQQAAPVVMDGISSETIAKSPDSDAGDAITRVTGAAVVGEKYVYVRGLGEKYANTLLNGVELPSPEPTKRVVPLDLFPASLLDNIITSKTARPDRPGDVTGASVEIETREFPENRILQLSVGTEYNSQTTFESVQRAGWKGSDWLARGVGRRSPTGPFPTAAETFTPQGELWAESIRNVWTPRQDAPLNTSFNFNAGGLLAGGDRPLGAILSFTHSMNTQYIPDRLFQVVRTGTQPVAGTVFEQTTSTVDWGGILNFTWRPGQNTKLSFKNLYTAGNEESFYFTQGYSFENPERDFTRNFQVVYVERALLQSQLVGEHALPSLGNSRIDWKASYAYARRDEPENRSLQYGNQFGPTNEFRYLPIQANGYTFFRFLDDYIFNGAVDWAFPLSLRQPGDLELKAGGLARLKDRAFEARTYQFGAPLQFDNPALTLPPEQLFAPENIGSVVTFRVTNGPPAPGGSQADEAVDPTYDAIDQVYAGYGMFDWLLSDAIRLVGGVRVESWLLRLYNGGRDATTSIIRRKNTDILPSLNVTFSLAPGVNLRLAGTRTVARPEARELSPAFYVPITGECGVYGNADLERTLIWNADARLEWYPRGNELLAVSAFYKDFDQPIFETISFASATNCLFGYQNAQSGRIFGFEAEARKALDFLDEGLANVSVGVNVTYTKSTSTVVENTVTRERQFLGQSPWLFNGSVSYDSPDGGFSAALLANYFDDRISRFGETLTGTQGGEDIFILVPDVLEKGRLTLDAKVRKRFGPWSVSVAGSNLTDNQVLLIQEQPEGEVVAGRYKLGVNFSVGVGYDF